MTSNVARVLVIGIVGFVAVQTSHANVPDGVAWGPQLQAIHDAASLRDPVEREASLRQAVRRGLLESGPDTANEVFGYLSRSIRWLDLQPLEDIVMEFSRVDPTHRGIWLLDEAALLRTPRDERLRVYSTAIVNGSTTLGHGRPLPRQSAMLAASDDGLSELRPLIETHFADEPAEVRRDFPLPELLTRLDLGAGAADREDAGRLASERLATMKDVDFRQRMDTDPAFEKVVVAVSSYVCDVNPYLRRRNPGCASIKDVVRRQLELEAAARTATKGASVRSAQEYEEWRGTWLASMQESSQGEPSAQLSH